MDVLALLPKLALAFVALGSVCVLLERFFPNAPAQKALRRGVGTDCLYWFLTPPVVVILSAAVVSGTMSSLLTLSGNNATDSTALTLGMDRLPMWIQVVIGLVVGDLLYYGAHRALHTRFLWPFHAVHHSSVEVDWLSAVRVHPVNNLLVRSSQALFMVLMGFSPQVVAICVPLLFCYAVLLHSNLRWDLGVFGHVFVSPVYHRWHHTTEREALDANYAGMFVFWDRVFDTYYHGWIRLPVRFGTDTPVPDTFLAQMVWPFRPSAFQNNTTRRRHEASRIA